MPFEPRLIVRYQLPTAIRISAVTPAVKSERRVTAALILNHIPPSTSGERRRPITGSVSQFTPRPIRLSIAGSSVSAAATAAITTRIAPAPKLLNVVSGMMNIPDSAITTASPENSTARLAVPPATPIASIFSRPLSRSSR